MRKVLFISMLFVLLSRVLFAQDGLITVKSAHDVKQTADRLEKVLKSKGLTVFDRIDHAKGAVLVGQKLLPTELIIFGNPAMGTKLMNCQRSVAIDLPLKALIWQDKKGQTWLSYNDPQYLYRRHHLKGCEPVIKKMENALHNLAAAATKP